MKYIRLYKESSDQELIKNYFKDKIDWKLINQLQYHLTKYEDSGYSISIKIDIKYATKSMGSYLICSIVDGATIYVKYYDELLDIYNHNPKLYYNIDILDEGGSYIVLAEFEKILGGILEKIPGYKLINYIITKSDISTKNESNSDDDVDVNYIETPGDITKAYFKDRIDWKLVNKLQYLLTKYEDMGYGVIIEALFHTVKKYSYLVVCEIYTDSVEYKKNPLQLNQEFEKVKDNYIKYNIRFYHQKGYSLNSDEIQKIMNDILPKLPGYELSGGMIRKSES